MSYATCKFKVLKNRLATIRDKTTLKEKKRKERD